MVYPFAKLSRDGGGVARLSAHDAQFKDFFWRVTAQGRAVRLYAQAHGAAKRLRPKGNDPSRILLWPQTRPCLGASPSARHKDNQRDRGSLRCARTTRADSPCSLHTPISPMGKVAAAAATKTKREGEKS
jgi:hypothetical protein